MRILASHVIFVRTASITPIPKIVIETIETLGALCYEKSSCTFVAVALVLICLSKQMLLLMLLTFARLQAPALTWQGVVLRSGHTL